MTPSSKQNPHGLSMKDNLTIINRPENGESDTSQCG